MRYVKTFENFNQTEYNNLNEGIIGDWFRNTVMNWGWVKKLTGDYKEGAKLAAEYLEKNPQVAEKGVKELSTAIESGKVKEEELQGALDKIQQFKGVDPAKEKQLEAELEKTHENYNYKESSTIMKFLGMIGFVGGWAGVVCGVVGVVLAALTLSGFGMIVGAIMAVCGWIIQKCVDNVISIRKHELQKARSKGYTGLGL